MPSASQERPFIKTSSGVIWHDGNHPALVGFESPQESSKEDPPSSLFEVRLQLPFGADECLATSYLASASHPDQPARV